MGRSSVREIWLLPLAAVLLGIALQGAAAAVPASEREAALAVRAALDRADLAGALALIDDALTRFGTRDAEMVWALRVMRGEALISRGRPKEAKHALAFELPKKYGHGETAVRQMIMRGFVAMHEGDFPAATTILEQAKALAIAHQPALLSDVYMPLSQADASRGDEYAREAIRLARKYGRKASEVKALAALARRRAGQQRYAESIQWGEQALPLARSLRNDKTVQQIEGNLGWQYFEIGDYEQASELFTSAEATARRIGADYDRVAWLIQLGNIHYQRRDWVAADRFNREAAALARTGKYPQLGYALANLARISIELGRFDDARRFNAEALAEKRAHKDEEAELSSDIVDARIALASPDHARAQKLLDGVVRDTKRKLTRMEAESRLGQLFWRMGRADQATVHFQRGVQAAREARTEVTNAELRFSFFDSAAELFDAYVDFLVAVHRAEDALSVTEISRAESLEEGLNVRSVARSFDARAISKQNGATILTYWLGRDRSYLWVITAERVTLHPLPPDTTIAKAVESYRRELLGPRGTLQGSGARGEELYTMLVGPAAVPRGSAVIVVADGQLHTLNFETLVTPAPRHYWIEDVILMNASSLQLLARTGVRPKRDATILLVGNAPPPDPSFPPLPHAAREIELIARHFAQRATVLTGPRATPASYQAASPGKFDFVHFVAHGVATRKRPLDSAVILASDGSKSYKLLAREVIESPLSARLVTISSCHGAGMRTYAGEGVVGLAWAFLRAGADQVIAALWEVSDAATPKLMDRMYTGIGAGRDPAVALRDAKLSLVRAAGLERKPMYWAPFVLYVGERRQ
ncbi:MAG: CHAT domain-containing protein [Acidobacteriota bacterium]